METLEAIRTRRSIRSFTDRPVPGELIRQLLSAAMSAPSAGNQQPWHFVVIDDRKILDAVPSIHPYAGMCRSAPLGILVCADTTLEKFKGFWVQDCSAATQNLLLAAHDQGLGAVWTGIHPLEERIRAFRTLCGLPEHVIPLALVVLGYPDQMPGPEDRFREDRVHSNRW
ncbi:MAG: nitroreductase family protein [Syntrophobacteraceae bacterium]|nr:nitroreductase family protein [Syntrophobacteraceae bacterium]